MAMEHRHMRHIPAMIEQVRNHDCRAFRRRGAHRGCRNAFSLVGLLAMVFAGSLFGVAQPAFAASPLSWASPVPVDDLPPFAAPTEVSGVSCPSRGLCVAVDGVGD